MSVSVRSCVREWCVCVCVDLFGQVISNACGTQALVHVLLNAEGVDLGETLSNFKAFTADFPSDVCV